MCLQLLPQNKLWVTGSKVPHLLFVLAFASCFYSAAEVLAYHGLILAKIDAWEEGGGNEELHFFLSTGMNVAGFTPVLTKLVLFL